MSFNITASCDKGYGTLSFETNSTRVTLPALPNGGTCSFRVSAQNSYGVNSIPSVAKSLTIGSMSPSILFYATT